MRALVPFVLLTTLTACSGGIQAPKKQRLSTKEIVELSKPAIVRIESKFDAENAGVGTGFVVTKEGHIATNLHVIHGATDITVVLLDGTRVPVTRIVAVDEQRDLAIVSIEPEKRMQTLALGDSDGVAAGDRVIAIGNPLGVLDYTVSDGLISSVRPLSQSFTILQISAPISQGSSGGPLFNHYGEVIGVATAIFGEGQNLNFGVPANYLRKLLTGKMLNLTPQEYAAQARDRAKQTARGGSQGKIVRKVPRHEVDILEGCSDETVISVFQSIAQAIELGAPLYNEGNHEACFRIYEGTTIRLEREVDCPGLRDALGHGLLRVNTLSEGDYTGKAWALRDTFDGILDVIQRKAQPNAPTPTPQP